MSVFEKYLRYRKAMMDESNTPKIIEWGLKNPEAYFELEAEWEKENALYNAIWELEHELENRKYGWRNMSESDSEITKTLNQLKSYRRLKYGLRDI